MEAGPITGGMPMFYYGPVPNDPDPTKMYHHGCGLELKLDQGVYSCGCGDRWEETEVNREERRVNGTIRGIPFEA